MGVHRLVSPIAVLALPLMFLFACGSGTEAIDTTGLSRVVLRVEGMT
jgi:hypothetical protein